MDVVFFFTITSRVDPWPWDHVDPFPQYLLFFFRKSLLCVCVWHNSGPVHWSCVLLCPHNAIDGRAPECRHVGCAAGAGR